MALLMRALVALAMVTIPTVGLADPLDQWTAPIAEAAARFGVPVNWIRKVMRQESGGSILIDGRPVVSLAGAMGLMQLMPATWRDVRASLGLGQDPFDPHDNILAGTFYLRLLYDRFGYPGLFAAYNAGPARYASHLLTGRSLPRETRAYLASLVANPRAARRAPIARPVLTLFAIRSAGGATETGGIQTSGELQSLFVNRDGN